MDHQHLELKVKDFLKKYSIELSELKWITEGRQRILQMAIMFEDGSMDLETCSLVSTEISDDLDQWLSSVSEYSLEVCSPGAERELKSSEEMRKAVGKYVKVLFLHPMLKSLEWSGYLKSFDGTKGSLEVRIKSVKKIIEFESNNIVKIRLAVIG